MKAVFVKHFTTVKLYEVHSTYKQSLGDSAGLLTDAFRATPATNPCCTKIDSVMINFKVSTSKVELPLSDSSYFKIQLKVVR